jgi:hypothetical protein
MTATTNDSRPYLVHESHLEDELAAMTDEDKIAAVIDEGMADDRADPDAQLVDSGQIAEDAEVLGDLAEEFSQVATTYPEAR